MKEKLIDILNDFFCMDDTYAYTFTKSKFSLREETATVDDFAEFTDEDINELAEHIIKEFNNEFITNKEQVKLAEMALKNIELFAGMIEKTQKGVFVQAQILVLVKFIGDVIKELIKEE